MTFVLFISVDFLRILSVQRSLYILCKDIGVVPGLYE